MRNTWPIALSVIVPISGGDKVDLQKHNSKHVGQKSFSVLSISIVFKDSHGKNHIQFSLTCNLVGYIVESSFEQVIDKLQSRILNQEWSPPSSQISMTFCFPQSSRALLLEKVLDISQRFHFDKYWQCLLGTHNQCQREEGFPDEWGDTFSLLIIKTSNWHRNPGTKTLFGTLILSPANWSEGFGEIENLNVAVKK